jgi:hypothetical protein
MGRDGNVARGVIKSVTHVTTPQDGTGKKKKMSGGATLALAETCGTETGI